MYDKSTSCLQSENFFFLHPPAAPIVIDDSSWKNAAESFTVALASPNPRRVQKCNIDLFSLFTIVFPILEIIELVI